MKKNIKLFAVAIAAVMTIGGATFASCSKDTCQQKEGRVQDTGTPDYKEGKITLAHCNTGSGLSSLTFNFNEDAFEQQFNQMLSGYPGGDYILNDIEIIDDAVGNAGSKPCLAISIVDVASGNTETRFAVIDKTVTDDTAVYSTSGKGLTILICSGKNCTNGCAPNPERTGCTPCENSNGECSSFSLNISLGDVFDKAIELIKNLSE